MIGYGIVVPSIRSSNARALDANRGRDNPKVDGQRKRSDVRRGEIRRTKKCLPEFNRRFLIGAGGFFGFLVSQPKEKTP